VHVDTLEQAQHLRERTDDSSAVVATVAQRVELLLVAAVPVTAIRCVWRTSKTYSKNAMGRENASRWSIHVHEHERSGRTHPYLVFTILPHVGEADLGDAPARVLSLGDVPLGDHVLVNGGHVGRVMRMPKAVCTCAPRSRQEAPPHHSPLRARPGMRSDSSRRYRKSTSYIQSRRVSWRSDPMNLSRQKRPPWSTESTRSELQRWLQVRVDLTSIMKMKIKGA
jgi:hypothetical protein